MRGKIAFPVFLILFLTVLLFAIPAPGEGRLTSGEYEYYVLEDSSARIVSWLGEGTEAVVPAELDGHPVSVLGYAFYRNDTLTSVTLPDTLAEIEKDAFNGCSSLTSVSFPPSLRIIGEDAFRGCSSLTELTIPDTVEMVDSGAFADCGGITRVTAPGNAEYGFFTVFETAPGTRLTVTGTEISRGAFDSWEGLSSVTIEDTVSKIGDSAFYWGLSLTEVVIPESVTEIGNSAFVQCNHLTSIVIPDSVTRIGSSCFDGCRMLSSVTLSRSLTEIGSYAFNNCKALSKLDLPDTLQAVGVYAFEGTGFPEGRDRLLPAPEAYPKAKDLRNKHPKIKKGEKVLPLYNRVFDGNLYMMLPEASRTADPSKAAYSLLVTVTHQSRSDYTGPARDTFTEVYLYAKKTKKLSLLASFAYAPPESGYVYFGRSLDGKEASGSEIMDVIGDIFP